MNERATHPGHPTTEACSRLAGVPVDGADLAVATLRALCAEHNPPETRLEASRLLLVLAGRLP